MLVKNLAEWRELVLQRDNYTCQICRQEATVAHHIKQQISYPELILEVDNGKALCQECHHYIRIQRLDDLSTRKFPLIAEVQGIVEVGGSLMITLPASFVRAHSLKKGDEVGILANHILKLDPMKEGISEGTRPS